jgi:hypothetical protein
MSPVHDKRVDHVIWLVKPENILGYVDHFSELLDVEFDHMDGSLAPTDGAGSHVRGMDIWLSWEAGIELLAPNDETPASAYLLELLNERGEGPYGVVWAVQDLDASLERLAGLGLGGSRRVVQSPVEAERRARLKTWTSRVLDVREANVEANFLNTALLIGQFTYRD